NQQIHPRPSRKMNLSRLLMIWVSYNELIKSTSTTTPLPIAGPSRGQGQEEEHDQGNACILRLHPCKICGEPFKAKSSVTKHIRKLHPGVHPYQCDLCDKDFSNSNNLNYHMRIHSGEKPYLCKICSKSFRASSDLRKHTFIHCNTRPYTCKTCNARFRKKTHLKQHEHIHTGEKPYECDICGKRLNSRFTLMSHRRNHADEKRFSCEICNAGFAYKRSLNKHQENHKNKKPHTCRLCNQLFAKRRHLRDHMKVHVKQKPFACELCGNRYSSISYLDKHMMAHMRNMPLILEMVDECLENTSEPTRVTESPIENDIPQDLIMSEDNTGIFDLEGVGIGFNILANDEISSNTYNDPCILECETVEEDERVVDEFLRRNHQILICSDSEIHASYPAAESSPCNQEEMSAASASCAVQGFGINQEPRTSSDDEAINLELTGQSVRLALAIGSVHYQEQDIPTADEVTRMIDEIMTSYRVTQTFTCNREESDELLGQWMT
ncbi:hypothetical protein QAD02_009514, partial [Eretmocerus hayati]